MTDNAIALLGGSFDPVHLGHLQCARQLANSYSFERFFLVPCHVPAHRNIIGEANHRLAMLKLALQEFPELEIDHSEMEKNSPSYTVETLKYWRKKLGEKVSISWVLGSDAFATINSWHQWQQLTAYGNLLVVQRAGTDQQGFSTEFSSELKAWLKGKRTEADKLAEQTHGSVAFVELEPWLISSTEVREFFSGAAHDRDSETQKSTVKNLLPPSVWQYIEQHKLYR